MKLLLAATLVLACSAHDGLPINPALGVGGFPDCVQTRPVTDDVAANARSLSCAQRPRDTADQIAIGCIGDSITAGVHSSGGNHTYPGQLQILLDAKYPGKYKVTNLGACGSTMMKGADSPYWKRSQYTALTTAKWDTIIIMLGTNDAKDKASHGPPNWPHDCTGAGQGDDPSKECAYFKDYGSMIDLVRTLGTTAGTSPDIHLAVPPPLMQVKGGFVGRHRMWETPTECLALEAVYYNMAEGRPARGIRGREKNGGTLCKTSWGPL